LTELADTLVDLSDLPPREVFVLRLQPAALCGARSPQAGHAPRGSS
jgi:hypothetical protein